MFPPDNPDIHPELPSMQSLFAAQPQSGNFRFSDCLPSQNDSSLSLPRISSLLHDFPEDQSTTFFNDYQLSSAHYEDDFELPISTFSNSTIDNDTAFIQTKPHTSRPLTPSFHTEASEMQPHASKPSKSSKRRAPVDRKKGRTENSKQRTSAELIGLVNIVYEVDPYSAPRGQIGEHWTTCLERLHQNELFLSVQKQAGPVLKAKMEELIAWHEDSSENEDTNVDGHHDKKKTQKNLGQLLFQK
ncbi:hypothetical protein EV360DRAFT_90592 [Lentinula raphanica]|nr:hypothetical protein EV360DRAFT_90592 [Lentinula raphanica]